MQVRRPQGGHAQIVLVPTALVVPFFARPRMLQKPQHKSLKLPGNNVALCRGNISFAKQRQYQEFYNRTLLLRKQKLAAKSSFKRGIKDQQKVALEGEGSAILPFTQVSG